MHNLKVLAAIMVLFTMFVSVSIAQEEETESPLTVSGTMVSNYVWRGVNLSNTLNFQPGIDLSSGNFSAGFWGSMDILKSYKELDIYLSYTLGPVKFGLVDYYVPLAGLPYSKFENKNTDHTVEFYATYANESIGIDATASVLVYGADKKIDDNTGAADPETNNYSIYFEIGYTADVKGISLRPHVGVTPYASLWYGDLSGTTDGFNVVNLGLTASKEIKVTDSFSIPVFSQVTYNPQADDIYVVFGLTF